MKQNEVSWFLLKETSGLFFFLFVIDRVIISGSVQYFRIKIGSNRFGLVFLAWLGFFLIWLGFFGLSSIQFFWFQA
jgi:hypothetical protein